MAEKEIKVHLRVIQMIYPRRQMAKMPAACLFTAMAETETSHFSREIHIRGIG